MSFHGRYPEDVIRLRRKYGLPTNGKEHAQYRGPGIKPLRIKPAQDLEAKAQWRRK